MNPSAMAVKERSDNRVILGDGAHRAAVRLDWDGQSKRWLLSAYVDEERRPAGDTTVRPGALLAEAQSPCRRRASA